MSTLDEVLNFMSADVDVLVSDALSPMNRNVKVSLAGAPVVKLVRVAWRNGPDRLMVGGVCGPGWVEEMAITAKFRWAITRDWPGEVPTNSSSGALVPVVVTLPPLVSAKNEKLLLVASDHVSSA